LGLPPASSFLAEAWANNDFPLTLDMATFR
jgi:hypothetical protein